MSISFDSQREAERLQKIEEFVAEDGENWVKFRTWIARLP